MSMLFLDIDGVLNSQTYITKKHNETGKCLGGSTVEMLDPDAISELNRIIDRTSAEIVLSSTWRMGENSGNSFVSACR